MPETELKSMAQIRWDRVEHLLAAALAYDQRGTSTADVRADFLNGKYLLFDGIETAVLADSVSLDGGPLMHVWLAGGRMGEFRDVLLPRVETVAHRTGHRGVAAIGRRGWKRALRPNGYHYCGENGAGETVMVKPLNPATFKEPIQRMSAVNFSVTPDYIAVATDTLCTDVRDWWPSYLTSKAILIPHLEAAMTATAFPLMMQDAYNFALSAPVADFDGLVPLLSPICRQAFLLSLDITRSMHSCSEDLSWAGDGFLALFGYSTRHGRLTAVRYGPSNDFEPQVLADGVYMSPSFTTHSISVTPENVSQLCDITRAQQEYELQKTPADRNAIGGDVLLWEMRANAQGVSSSVRRLHRFESRTQDLAFIQRRDAA